MSFSKLSVFRLNIASILIFKKVLIKLLVKALTAFINLIYI